METHCSESSSSLDGAMGRQSRRRTLWGRTEDNVPLLDRMLCDVFFISEPYVHVVAQQGARSVLESTLVGRTVQNAREQRVQGQLLLQRRVVEAPAPAAAVWRWRKHKKKKHLLGKIPA